MVVFPESGWEIMARLRRRVISGRRVMGDDDGSVVEWRVVWWLGRVCRFEIGWRGVKAVMESISDRDIVITRRLRRISAIFIIVCTLKV